MKKFYHCIDETKDLLITRIGEVTRETVGHPLHDWRARRDLVNYLQRAGACLHARYENACSYEWAYTEQYEKGTEGRERRIMERIKQAQFPGTLTFQGDPRGWPLVFTIDGREYRLGGRVKNL